MSHVITRWVGINADLFESIEYLAIHNFLHVDETVNEFLYENRD